MAQVYSAFYRYYYCKDRKRMTHGQRAYARDASDLTVETAIMATYNASTLPKGVASGLADAAKAAAAARKAAEEAAPKAPGS